MRAGNAKQEINLTWPCVKLIRQKKKEYFEDLNIDKDESILCYEALVMKLMQWKFQLKKIHKNEASILKGYLHYKMITSKNVSSEAQLTIFFIS